jgi:hypothetical protein
MKHTILIALSLAPLVSACVVHNASEVRQQISAGNPGHREWLFAPLRALEGRWVGQDPSGAEQVVEFRVSSGGSAVREVMFPGSEHEMTNMYTLDGDSVAMTHYCAAGNQPRLRGNMQAEGRMVFETEVVGDLKAADELYMGKLTLVFVDADHIEEHWTALRGDKVDHEMVFKLARVK